MTFPPLRLAVDERARCQTERGEGVHEKAGKRLRTGRLRVEGAAEI